MIRKASSRHPFARVARLCIAALIVAAFAITLPRARASALPQGFVESLVLDGLLRPTAMRAAPDGRLFIALQDGEVRIFDHGVLLEEPFVRVETYSNTEHGLVGLALDPQFSTNHYVYVYYTVAGPPILNRVTRFTANGDVADPNSGFVIFETDTVGDVPLHHGGAMRFGTDGMLYIATGDAMVSTNAQSLESTSGKILRIHPDGTIPETNPFYDETEGVHQAIWAMGLRNPFSFAIQPITGLMLINDVGNSLWEEINVGKAGANYGWPETEGLTDNPQYSTPIYVYPHGQTSDTGCAITAGVFYNPASDQFPKEFVGRYFFADYCNGWIRSLDVDTGEADLFATDTLPGIVSLEVMPDGSLLYLARAARGVNVDQGTLVRIRYAPSAAPQITYHPASVTVANGSAASFVCSAAGDPAPEYHWQRNGEDIPEAANLSVYTLTTTSLEDSGARFRCVVVNEHGSAASDEAVLTVADGSPPSATITAPAVDVQYSAGRSIFFSGTAVDAEDGLLPASAFRWTVVFHHDAHTHPVINAISGIRSGSFYIPPVGETAVNVWYSLLLTVTDSDGLTRQVTRDIYPQVVTIRLVSDPVGLTLTLDGQPHTAPYEFPAVVGMHRTVSADAVQTLDGVEWQFAQWSDFKPAVHVITIPGVDTTFTADYRVAAADGNLKSFLQTIVHQ